MREQPLAVCADDSGIITEVPGIAAAGRCGRTLQPITTADLIILPRGSTLYRLPERYAVGYDSRAGTLHRMNSAAVAAFLPPGYTATALAAFDREAGAPMLPLYCYCALCWYHGKFYVPAIRVDKDPKHDPSSFDRAEVSKRVKQMLRKNPDNRLLAHHGNVCALQYHCPNAANLFLGRWEAPVAVSGSCNSACRGCISKQNAGSVTSSQTRIDFTPTVEEILGIAVPHLEQAPRAMISFGQGCEGEPLLKGRLIENAIRAIRRQTTRGTIHLNTNGSKPKTVQRLIDAGLNSIRISLNSARPKLYRAYYRCDSYTFSDVVKSFKVARMAGLMVSANYLTFPGVTDDGDEYSFFRELLVDAKPDMIQWRNLNIDPDCYM
ncbi:MAG: radical SAM protein, partial [bacterium]